MSNAAGLAFRAQLPARETLLEFLFDDNQNRNGCSSCKRLNTRAVTTEATRADEDDGIIFALAPGATHIAAARGSRFTISALSLQIEEPASDTPFCTEDIHETAVRERISAVCWVGYCGSSYEVEGSQNFGCLGDDHALFLVVGTSMGTVRIYTSDAHLLFCKSFATVVSSTECNGAPVRAFHHRISRTSHARSDATEDLTIVFDSMAVRIDAMELRSVALRAIHTRPILSHLAGKRVEHESLKKGGSDHRPALENLNDILNFNSPALTATRLGLSKLTPLADACFIGQLSAEFAQSALSSGARVEYIKRVLLKAGGVLASSRDVHRGRSRVVSLLAKTVTSVAQENTLEAIATFASKAASSAVSAMTDMVGGALHLAGAMSNNNISVTHVLPKTAEGEGRDASGRTSGIDICGNEQENHSFLGYSLDWCSALFDSTRRVHTIIPAPRGSIFAIIDTLDRISIVDAAVPSMITIILIVKGCRNAEVAWLELPPKGNAKASRNDVNRERLYVVIRSPHRNKGNVEFWEVGGLGVGTVSTLSKTGFGSRGCVDMGCSTLLQAAFSFRASVRQYDSVNTAGYFGERSRCYLLARNGDLYEVVM